jgi:integrase
MKTMGSSIKQRNGKYTVQIRHPMLEKSLCSTFTTQDDAFAFKRRVLKALETAKADGSPIIPEILKMLPSKPGKPLNVASNLSSPNIFWTLRRAIEEYEKTDTPKKKGKIGELNRFKHIKASKISDKILSEITTEDIFDFKNSLLNKKNGSVLQNQTVRNYIYSLSSVFEKARNSKYRNGWGLNVLNPTRDIELPKVRKTSDVQRISKNLISDFFIELGNNTGEYRDDLIFFYKVSLFTGMRRSEIINLKFSDFIENGNIYIIKLRETKSGYSRDVYLNSEITEIFSGLVDYIKAGMKRELDSKVFLFSKDYASKKFKSVMVKLMNPSVRLHDLRHEALSRMADAGFSLKELMAQSGHRTASVASRYLHINGEEMKRKMEKI